MTHAARTYTVGYLLALGLTALAFVAMTTPLLSPSTALAAALTLGIMQVGVHLRYFLHLGEGDSAERWAALLFSLVIAGIMVAGSLWVVGDLNARMMG